jgi:ATP-binding cassette subfamily C protein CydD
MLTHRLQFLAQMDHVIVMDEGKIIQQGTLDSLMQDKSSYFCELYAYQFAGEREIACVH